jgi:hypothetical protein
MGNLFKGFYVLKCLIRANSDKSLEAQEISFDYNLMFTFFSLIEPLKISWVRYRTAEIDALTADRLQ